MKTILLTGGGTGGHVIPHLSLLPFIKKDFDKIYYIGTPDGIEKDIILNSKEDISYYSIPAVKLKRDNFFKNLALPFKLLTSIQKAKKTLKKLKPDVIFSKGGYVSVPVCIAGKMLKIPVVSHESDLTMGLANKIIYRFCNVFCTSFEKTAQGKDKAVFTGSPVRKQLFNGNKTIGYNLTKVNPNKPTILVMGGSTGAKALNEKLYESLETILKEYNVIHIVGKGKGDKTKIFKDYCQLEYCHNIEDIFAITDIVVSRAGSNAIYEFLSLKKPMILIPLPKGASRGDQIDNAKYFLDKGFCEVILQEDLTKNNLLNAIKKLKQNKNYYLVNMQKTQSLNGAENIYKQILGCLKKTNN